MTAEEIRAMESLTQCDYLRELTAQLAELNQNLKHIFHADGFVSFDDAKKGQSSGPKLTIDKLS